MITDSVVLDCLFLIALSISSNVYCHSHFISLFCLRPCQHLIVYSSLHFWLSLTFIAIAISSAHFCLCSCQFWIVYSWLPFRFSLTFISIAISSPLFGLRSCQLWIVYTLVHFRLSLTFIAIAISYPFFVFVRVNTWLFILHSILKTKMGGWNGYGNKRQR
jgi:hypothetical protein